jgi:hypothetical protein
VLLDTTSGAPLLGAADVVRSLCELGDVYLIAKVAAGTGNEAEEKARAALVAGGFLLGNDEYGAGASTEMPVTELKEREWKREPTGPRGTLPHRVLFCSSDIGKTAFVRQLSPYLHVDSDHAVICTLAKHITKTLWCGCAAGACAEVLPNRNELFATPNEACELLSSFFQ